MNKLNLLIRVIIFASLFVFPWWAVLVLVLAALFMYDNYYEIILIGLLCDTLYSSSYSAFGLYGLTLIACVLLVLAQQIKKRLIMY